MKTKPETLILDAEDIKEAIRYWLNNRYSPPIIKGSVDIHLEARKIISRDPFDTMEITATAVKLDGSKVG